MRVPEFVAQPATDHAFDWRTKAGNEELARRIKKIWADLGHDVAVWAEGREIALPSGKYTIYELKSNLVNGLPPSLVGRSA